MELPRSAPISPTLHSKKTYNSAMPFSPDTNELYIENMKLSEENETLRKNFVNFLVLKRRFFYLEKILNNFVNT